MKFKTRLFIGFGVVLVVMIILAGSALHFLHQQHLHVNEIVKERYERVKLANTIQNETNNTARMLRNLLLDENEAEVDLINKSRINASSAINAFEKLNNNEEIGQLITKLRLTNDDYNNASKVVIELAQQGKIAKGTNVLMEDHREVRVDLVNDSQMLTKIEEEVMHKAVDQSYIQYKQAIKVFLVFVLYVFLLDLV
jgi:two-component system, chemotaxis family, sensor kinase CheA